MKQLTIKISDEQYEELKELSEECRINNVSCLIRLSLDDYLKKYMEYKNHIERRAHNEHDQYQQK